jgi:hypothetical protein
MNGSSVFSSSDSFGLIRGFHLDLTILGALQVSGDGDLANWCIPGKMMKGIGGAMDICSGVKRIIVATTHLTRDGKPKIVKKCTLPLTGIAVAEMIITELAVFRVRQGAPLLLLEYAPGVTVEEIRSKTAADFEVSPDLHEMRFSPLNTKHAPPPPKPAAAPAADEPTDLPTLFEKLRAHPDFAMLREMLKGKGGAAMLSAVLPMIAKQSPGLARAVKADKDEFLRLINEA